MRARVKCSMIGAKKGRVGNASKSHA